MKPFEGKVAVVTGGTQGLGAAIAALFVERGARGVVICGRSKEKGEAKARALGGASDVRFVPADLTRVEDCRAVIAAADGHFGRVDVLVNAAAMTDRGTLLDTSPELFDRIFATNVRAPFFLMQEAVTVMRRERTEGAIVNICSMSALAGQPFIAAYCASKGALATLTRNAAYALLRNRIRVNGLNLGWMVRGQQARQDFAVVGLVVQTATQQWDSELAFFDLGLGRAGQFPGGGEHRFKRTHGLRRRWAPAGLHLHYG